MPQKDSHIPMHIRLSDDRRTRLLEQTVLFFDQELDQEISAFQSERLLDFFVKELGPPVYNQAIQDARGFIQSRLEDLEGEFYEPLED